jgi:predicted metal-dependent phosphoesterase TrpH
MPELFADMHCHSTASDGSLSPAQLLRMAAEQGLSALALTDHDTVAGVPEAAQEAARLGVAFLPGIEISCEAPAPATLHLLGYGVDPASACLASLTRGLIEAREERNPRMIQRLRELSVDVTMAEWQREAGGTVGRPHLAQILVRKGYVSSVKAAFDKYLGQGGLAYFDKERLPAKRAIEMVHESGGVAVLAHPSQLRCSNDAQLETLLKNLVDEGLDGIEVLHSDHDVRMISLCEQLAKKFRLLRAGGSDFHGASKKHIALGRVGHLRVPRTYFDDIARAAAARAGVRSTDRSWANA